MALINCDECGEQISSRAIACPKCGNPLHPSGGNAGPSVPPSITIVQAADRAAPKSILKRITAGVFLVILGIVVLSLYLTDSPSERTRATSTATTQYSTSPHTAPATQTAPAPPVAPSIIDISAEQLYADYAANEVLADSKYKGQWLHVTGTVVEIGKDIADDPYVTLFGENRYATVHAWFKKSMNGRLSELRKGEQIALTCVGKGRLIGDAIIDCRQDHVPKYQPKQQNAAVDGGGQAQTSGAPADVGAPTIYETSFDCSKARSISEHLICQDAELAALDRSTSATFSQAKAVASDQKAFAQMIRRNWNWRNKNCVDKTCLVNWYTDEQKQLNDVISGAGQAAAN